MRVLFTTLGCRCNQFETAAMEQELKRRGHQIVTENPDVVVVNGCAVTAESARKSRQTARRLKKDWPAARLAVCGCWPQAEPDEARACGAELIGGSGPRLPFLDAMESLSASAPVETLDVPLHRRSFEPLPPAKLEGRTRAYMKVEDGCVNFCAYCIIPYLRGPIRSLPLEEAARQAAQLSHTQVRELTLTGIELASYQYGLAELIETVTKAAPELRIRLGSLEPRVIDTEFCERLSGLERLCPHFHLSMQSGCDETLHRMGRKYDTERFYESVVLLRKWFPGCGITTDLITGFPGETETEFQQTLEFLDRCRFSHVHVFPYSERKGTRAAQMPDSVPKALREERAREAIRRADRWEQEFLQAQVGTVQSVLFESRQGHTPNYCETEMLPDREGDVCEVRIIGVKNGKLLVETL